MPFTIFIKKILFQTHLKGAAKTLEKVASVINSLEALLFQVATIETTLPTCMATEALITLEKESQYVVAKAHMCIKERLIYS